LTLLLVGDEEAVLDVGDCGLDNGEHNLKEIDDNDVGLVYADDVPFFVESGRTHHFDFEVAVAHDHHTVLPYYLFQLLSFMGFEEGG
jgi:hypothetical protein